MNKIETNNDAARDEGRAQHTPGAWTCPGTDGGEHVICHRDKTGKRRTLAHVYSEANARLIAKSPEMAELIRRILYASETPNGASIGEAKLCRMFRDMARDILADVDGRPQ